MPVVRVVSPRVVEGSDEAFHGDQLSGRCGIDRGHTYCAVECTRQRRPNRPTAEIRITASTFGAECLRADYRWFILPGANTGCTIGRAAHSGMHYSERQFGQVDANTLARTAAAARTTLI